MLAGRCVAPSMRLADAGDESTKKNAFTDNGKITGIH